ncbi:MAG: hypothetical protein NZM43_04345 [Saprospiraceae bacterium]|nr:hypothetical protein [Saprospiraceae bacterium]MDW8483538.1 hypothetical protein [Saprospiraceae bacterium]
MRKLVLHATKVKCLAVWAKVAGGILAGVTYSLSGCTDVHTPLDPKVRHRIDSTYLVRLQKVREELDSLCAQERLRRLPELMDSIRRRRLREIEQKLRPLPQ